MLVLSRKQDQKVRFPGLGITVQVVGVKGSSVRLGIDAPAEVRIIRDELDDSGAATPAPRLHVVRLPRELRHELRNELNSLSLALHLFKQELAAGYRQDAEATFDKLVNHIERIGSNEALSHDIPRVEQVQESMALVVEDSANEREMLAGLLRMNGYRVATACDGVEAMEYLTSHERPSVVLVDMRMPRCDGPTTIQRIRDNHAFDGIKIFAISGSTPEENRLDIGAAKVNGWFMKPLNPRSLVDAMAIMDRDDKATVA